MAPKIPPQTGPASKQIAWDATQLVTGMATSDYTDDGSIGTSSTLLNPYITQGVLYSTAAPTTPSGTITGAVIASCEDGTNVNGANTRFFLDDAAHFYLYNSSFTSKQAGAKTYTTGISDFAFFNSKTWATSTTDLTMWDGTATAGSTHFDETYWTSTKSQSALVSGSNNPHPLLVFEKLLWIGDSNKLHTLDESAAVVNGQLTLAVTESVIALGIDPSTGLMLISTVTVPDYTGSTATQAFLYLYDGISSKPRRKIAVDSPVTAFYNVAGQTFVAYGRNIGVWNGSGITFLRRLQSVTFANTSLPYRHRITNIGHKLLVVDGGKVLMYGQITPTQSSWFPVATSPAGNGSAIAYLGNNKLGVAGTTGTFSSFDLSSTSAGTGTVYTSNTNFDRKVYIRKLRIITGGISTTSGTGIGSIGIVDENLNNNQPAISKFINTGASAQYVFDFDYNGLQLQIAQPFVTFGTQGFGIVRIIVYFDPAE